MSNKVILRLGLFGGGVVGGGVCELLHSHSARLASMGVSVEVAKICVRDINKPRYNKCTLHACVRALHAIDVETSLWARKPLLSQITTTSSRYLRSASQC
jgi:homoserine dehydrogenase